MKRLLTIVAALAISSVVGLAQAGRAAEHWVGAWSTALVVATPVAAPGAGRGAPPAAPGQPAPAAQPQPGAVAPAQPPAARRAGAAPPGSRSSAGSAAGAQLQQSDAAAHRPPVDRRRSPAHRAEQCLRHRAARRRRGERRASRQGLGHRFQVEPRAAIQRKRVDHRALRRHHHQRSGGSRPPGSFRSCRRSLCAWRYGGERIVLDDAHRSEPDELRLIDGQLRRLRDLSCRDDDGIVVRPRARRGGGAPGRRRDRGARRLDHRRLAIDAEHEPPLAGSSGEAPGGGHRTADGRAERGDRRQPGAARQRRPQRPRALRTGRPVPDGRDARHRDGRDQRHRTGTRQPASVRRGSDRRAPAADSCGRTRAA